MGTSVPSEPDGVETPDVETPDEAERHANNLELFLDLVFVFAVTQIATLISHDMTSAGVGRALVITTLVWWQWSQYTWAGAAVDLQRGPVTRALVLCTIPAALTMTAAIPAAYGTTGRWFGVAYLIVQLLVLAMQGAEALRHESTRPAFLRYTSIASIAPLFVAVGGFTGEDARVWVWIAATTVNLIGALRAARGEWTVNPVHFAERHALFVIISLGEALVAIGGAATEAGLTGRTLAGLVSACGLACVLRWSYFAFIPNVAEHRLRQAIGVRRGLMARDFFTFGHFPIVGGIIYLAVVMKHMVGEPTEPLPTADRVLLAVGIAMVVGGYMNMQWRIMRRVTPERVAAVGAVAAWCALAADAGGAVVVAVVAALLAAMQTTTWRRYRHRTSARATASR